MTTHDKLTALSEAATQGVWTVIPYDAGDVSWWYNTPSIWCEESDCGIVHWDGFSQKFWEAANGYRPQMQANAELMAALVNGWRDGTIVAVDGPDNINKGEMK